MEEICKNCEHFEQKGLTISRNVLGFCKKFNIKGKPGIFRWGDAICTIFKPREEAKNLQDLK